MLPSDVYMMNGIGEARERLSPILASAKTAVISSHGVIDSFISGKNSNEKNIYIHINADGTECVVSES